METIMILCLTAEQSEPFLDKTYHFNGSAKKGGAPTRLGVARSILKAGERILLASTIAVLFNYGNKAK